MCAEGKGTYSELADLDVVETKDFVLVAHAELEDGDEFSDEVEGAEDEAGADEAIGTTGDGVGELVAELYVMVVKPAAGDNRNAIQVCNVVTIWAVSDM